MRIIIIIIDSYFEEISFLNIPNFKILLMEFVKIN